MKLFFKAVIMFLVPVTIHAQSVDDIIANSFETTGGIDNWKALKSMKATGKVPSPQGEFSFVIFRKKPNLFKMELDIQGTKLIPNAYDGKIAWTLNPFGGSTTAQKLPEEQKEEVLDQAIFENPFIDYQKKGHEVSLEGTEEIDGVECYVIKLIKNKNNDMADATEYHYLDTENYVTVMQKTYGRSGPQKGQELETYFSEYQELDNGLIVPYSFETKVNGQALQQIIIESIETDAEIDDEVFTFPGE